MMHGQKNIKLYRTLFRMIAKKPTSFVISL